MPNQNHIDTKVEKSSYECTITVDCCIFGFQEGVLKVLLVKRAIAPFKEFWMLPGGIMGSDQSLEEAANHILYHLTDVHDVFIEQVRTYSQVGRHPVKRVVTVSFYALTKPENHPAIAKHYVSDVDWCPVKEVPSLGFDHNKILGDALLKLRTNLDQVLKISELLPEKFTLKELQDLYESILDERLDRRNFRKKMRQMDFLVNTTEKKSGAKGGPLLYTIRNNVMP